MTTQLPARIATTLPALPYRPEELRAAVDYADAASAASTRRAYSSDWRIFTAWCAERSLVAMPADPETVAVFLASQADGGSKTSTLTRRTAAIAFAHRAAGVDPSPTAHEAVRRTMRGVRRTKAMPPAKKAPATAERVLVMVSHVPRTLTGLRDRAVLLLGFSGAFRRSELSALTVTDLEETADGLLVTVRRSKTDQEGAGVVVPVTRGAQACPVAAVRAWLAASAITDGPIFRPVDQRGTVGRRALTPFSIAQLVKRYAERAGLDPRVFGGHSLRSGFLTSAAERGKPLDRMMAISRHKRVDTVLGYVRRAEHFKDHAGEGLL
jgi:site-specific recombinase XerD